jgi:hypothetical protein
MIKASTPDDRVAIGQEGRWHGRHGTYSIGGGTGPDTTGRRGTIEGEGAMAGIREKAGRCMRRAEADNPCCWRARTGQCGATRTARSVVLSEIGQHQIIGKSASHMGVSSSCVYVLDPEPRQSLTPLHHHFSTPTSPPPLQF